jgi:hypothetical protein
MQDLQNVIQRTQGHEFLGSLLNNNLSSPAALEFGAALLTMAAADSNTFDRKRTKAVCNSEHRAAFYSEII